MENKLGIVIRYSDSTEKDGIDTIAEHNELFKKVGTAFVGKFGQPASAKYVDLCCQKDIQTFLILVKRNSDGAYEAHEAKIKSAQRKRPQSHLFPSYLQKRKDIKCWFELAEPLKTMNKSTLGKWVTKSSQIPLVESLSRSMSGIFYAIYDKDAKERSFKIPKKLKSKGKELSQPKTNGSKFIPEIEDDMLYSEELDFSYDD
jgi:hypothetical protein